MQNTNAGVLRTSTERSGDVVRTVRVTPLRTLPWCVVCCSWATAHRTRVRVLAGVAHDCVRLESVARESFALDRTVMLVGWWLRKCQIVIVLFNFPAQFLWLPNVLSSMLHSATLSLAWPCHDPTLCFHSRPTWPHNPLLSLTTDVASQPSAFTHDRRGLTTLCFHSRPTWPPNRRGLTISFLYFHSRPT